MSLLVKGSGITKLSELIIDTDKDWGEKKIVRPKLPDILVGLSKITVGITEPSNPSVNDLWVDCN